MELLNNDRILLRAVEPEDLEFMYKMENDSSFWSISNCNVPYSRYALKQYIANNHNNIYEDRQVRLMIVEKETEMTIGTIDLTDFCSINQKAEVGIAINKEYRNRGYATSALYLLHNYAFEFLNLHQLYAYVSDENIASKSLFEELGYCKAGILKDWIRKNNNYNDVIIMQYIK